MPKSVTFIHSADVHFGAPFRGLRALSEAWSQRLADAIPQAYDRLIDVCIEQDVDFLLLAGDIFDTDTVSYAHYRRFIDGLQRLCDAGIQVYACAGNHDPYSSWVHLFQELPPNVFFFASDKPDFVVFEKDGLPLVTIGARGFCNVAIDGDIAQGITRRAAENSCGVQTPFALGMLHTGFTIDTRKAPCKEKTLKSSGMDYWAFGHIHEPLLFPPEHPLFAYSGCIQGRDIKETGPRGCLKITLTQNEPTKAELIPLASVEWQQLCVSCEGCDSLAALRDRCISKMFDVNRDSACEEMVCRITLTGQTSLHQFLSQANTREEFRFSINENVPTFFCDSLIDKTISPRLEDVIRSRGLFGSAILSASDALGNHPELLREYLETEFYERSLGLPDDVMKKSGDLLHDAKNIIFDVMGDDMHD